MVDFGLQGAWKQWSEWATRGSHVVESIHPYEAKAGCTLHS